MGVAVTRVSGPRLGGWRLAGFSSVGWVSPEAVRLCHENGIDVIPGSCPMQFLGEDFPHTCMRGALRVTGALAMPAQA